MNTKKLLFNLTFFAITILVFVLIEVLLRIFGAGYNTEPFVRHPQIKQFYVDNKELRYKYYPKKIDLSRDPVKNIFLYKKPKGVLRGFVLGGSAAEGFPYYSNHSFSKILETGLNELKKFDKVEIINLGYSAMSSYYVADVSKKLLKYEPDFIVIYSGHNEYYGTISETTGGNHIAKKIYLALKELRIFQLIFEILGQSRWKNIKTKTMMAEQFNNKILPFNKKVDERVAENYKKNIKEVVDFFTKKKINVIIVEPVCNLINMPPFKGENDEIYSNKINSLQKILSGSQKGRFEIEKNERNANILYLSAFYKMLYEKDESLSNFILAKDMDTVPFRARSPIQQKLHELISEYKTCKYLHFIPLQERIFKNFGSRGFGNFLFIDHLHFNFTGHTIMANVLAQKLADIYNFSNEEREKLISFFQNEEVIKEKIYFTPLHEFLGFRSILLLSKQSPYSEMLIKYTPFIDAKNPFFENKEAYNLSEEELFNKILNEFIARKDFKSAFLYMNSVLSTYPGDSKNHLAMAELQRMVGNTEAAYNYILAYILSDRDYNYYKKLENYLHSIGQSAMLEKVISLYGKPKTNLR
ncbi:MAG: hypothetical protein ACP5QT_08395 [Brevinematia bacterium]